MPCLAFGFALAVMPAQLALAEDITHPGNGVLQLDPIWRNTADSLFSGTTANPGLSGNNVTVNGKVDGYVFGGASAGAGNVTNNRVIINGGTVGKDVYGGYSDGGTVSGNSVIINGGTMGSTVYGGYANSGNATYNTVTLSGSPTFSSSAGIYGGSGSSSGDKFTGNTMNVWNYSGSRVMQVQRFEFYNFVLPASYKGLEVGTTAYLNDAPSPHPPPPVPPLPA